MENSISTQEYWTNITEARMQTSNWDLTQPVTRENMQNIVDEIHRRSPSKQNQVNYGMHILDWSNTHLRNELYEMAVDRDNPDPKYNPQTLANWLVVFTGRVPVPLEYDFSDRDKDTLDLGLSSIEIGLASHMLIYSAAARGLQCGFCRCLDYEYSGFQTTILPQLGLDYPEEIQLLVGVGYPSDTIYKTWNPHTEQWVNAYKDQGSKWAVEPKPPQSEYVHWYDV